MSKTVFVLGAGASMDCGAPLMKDFVPRAEDLLRKPDLEPESKEAIRLVLKARAELLSVYPKAHVDIHNVESLFGIFEMAQLLGSLGPLDAKHISTLREAMEILISTAIEKSIRYRVESSRYPTPPATYKRFAELLIAIWQSNNNSWQHVSVLTFNYDVALDYACHFKKIPIDYGLSRIKSGDDRLELLKLHGSLNWGRCSNTEKCQEIVPFTMNQLAWDYFLNLDYIPIETSKLLCKLQHCETPIQSRPVIAPPTWNKGKYHLELETVWQRAARHLSEAENIFIIGYSLPPTDEFFRYFYALGSIGPVVPRNVWVIDPELEVARRFKKILGGAALAPECFRPVNQTFEATINSLMTLLVERKQPKREAMKLHELGD
ncbi:MAG TPA: hypothetical protein VN577_08955 [Terriglobales bacterium]|nr:hypothetical protein [Terriglobales bacterium]